MGQETRVYTFVFICISSVGYPEGCCIYTKIVPSLGVEKRGSILNIDNFITLNLLFNTCENLIYQSYASENTSVKILGGRFF